VDNSKWRLGEKWTLTTGSNKKKVSDGVHAIRLPENKKVAIPNLSFSPRGDGTTIWEK
jgi:hypothetical protein